MSKTHLREQRSNIQTKAKKRNDGRKQKERNQRREEEGTLLVNEKEEKTRGGVGDVAQLL